jgi:hypothetical protein
MFSSHQQRSLTKELEQVQIINKKLKRELQLQIDLVEHAQICNKQATHRAALVEEISKKHEEDLLIARTKIEENEKTIEKLANAVLKRERELKESKASFDEKQSKEILILRKTYEEEHEMKMNERERDHERDMNEIGKRFMDERQSINSEMIDRIQEMNEKFETERMTIEELNKTERESLIEKEREKHQMQVECLQKAWKVTSDDDRNSNENAKAAEAAAKEEALRDQIGKLEEELNKEKELNERQRQEPDREQISSESSINEKEEELEKMNKLCKEQLDTINRLEREVKSLDDVIDEQILLLEENMQQITWNEEENKRISSSISTTTNAFVMEEETRVILENACIEKQKIIELKDKEIFQLKRSIDTLNKAADTKRRNFEELLSEKESKHQLNIMTLQSRLEAASSAAKQHFELSANLKNRVEILERQNSKRIMQESTLRETSLNKQRNLKSESEKEKEKKPVVPVVEREKTTTTTTNNEAAALVTVATTEPSSSQQQQQQQHQDVQQSSISPSTKTTTTTTTTTTTAFRDAQKDITNLKKKVSAARKNAKIQSSSNNSNVSSPTKINDTDSKQKSEIEQISERSIVKRAIEAQNRTIEAAKGLSRMAETKKTLSF